MRVFLFGLFSRCTNLMNPSTELIQLILPHLHNMLLDASFHAHVCMLTTRFSIHAFRVNFIDTRVFAYAYRLASFYVLV